MRKKNARKETPRGEELWRRLTRWPKAASRLSPHWGDNWTEHGEGKGSGVLSGGRGEELAATAGVEVGLRPSLRELIQRGREQARTAVAFPIRDALRHELSWTHYRTLLRVKGEPARLWYMREAADHIAQHPPRPCEFVRDPVHPCFPEAPCLLTKLKTLLHRMDYSEKGKRVSLREEWPKLLDEARHNSLRT